MEEQSFLDSLRRKLGELNIPAPEADRYIKQFERYFNTLSDEEVREQINGFDSVDSIAHNIESMIRRKKNRSEEPFPDADLVAEATGSFDPVDEQLNTMEYDAAGFAAAQVELTDPDDGTAQDPEEPGFQTDEFEIESDFLYAMDTDADDGDAQSTSIVDAAFSGDLATGTFAAVGADGEAEKTASPADAEDAVSTDPVTAQQPEDDGGKTVEIESVAQTADSLAEQDAQETAQAQGGATRVDLPVSGDDVTDQDDPVSEEDFQFGEDLFEEYVPVTKRFVICTAASAVLWIPLLILAAALYGFAYCMLGLLIAALIVTLVVVTIAGTGLALVGLIYGITQLSVSAPIGLYELGLGIIIGGAALLAGVLLYNGAVRFMPWLIRKMNRFSRYSLRMLRHLIRYFKKACIR